MSDKIKPKWTGMIDGENAFAFLPLCTRDECPTWQDGKCKHGATIRISLDDRICGMAIKRMRDTLRAAAESLRSADLPEAAAACLDAIGVSAPPDPAPTPVAPKGANVGPIQPTWEDRVPICSDACPAWSGDEAGEGCHAGDKVEPTSCDSDCCRPAIRYMSLLLESLADNEDLSLAAWEACHKASGAKVTP